MKESDDNLSDENPEEDEVVVELREELVKTLNIAQNLQNVEEKQSYLALAKEIVLYRDPTFDKKLLKEFVGDICEFQIDRNPKIKRFVVEFLEEVCKVREDIIPTVLPSILFVLNDDNASTVKKALVAVNNLYRPALTLLCDEKYVQTKEEDAKRVYETLDEFRKKAVELLEGTHSACQIAAVRVLQTIALAQLAPDASGPIAISGRVVNLRSDTGPNAFTLLNVPRGGNAILHAAILETNAKQVVNKLIERFVNLDPMKKTDSRLGVLLTSSLTTIALQRPTVRKLIMDCLITKGNKIENQEGALMLTQALKANLLPLLKVDTILQNFKTPILEVLTKLGGAEPAAKLIEKQAKMAKKRGQVEEMEFRAIAEGTSLPAEMLKEQHFSPAEALLLRQMAVERMIKNCGERRILIPSQTILARVASDFVPPRVSINQVAAPTATTKRKRSTRGSKKKGEEAGKVDDVTEDDGVDAFTKQVDMRPLVLEHVCENENLFTSRLNLGLELLYHEFSYDILSNMQRTPSSSPKANSLSSDPNNPNFQRYDKFFQLLLKIVQSKHIPVSQYLKLLLKSPRLPGTGLGLIFEHCQSDDTQTSYAGLGALRDIINTKQALKERCTKAVLLFSVHRKTHVREASIRLLIGTLFGQNPDLQDSVKGFASSMLQSLLDQSHPDDELATDIGLEQVRLKPSADIEGGDEEGRLKKRPKKESDAAESETDASAETGADIGAMDLSRQLSLFVALCVHESNMLEQLLIVFSQLTNETVKNGILELDNFEKLIEKLGQDIGAASTIRLISRIPTGAYDIFLRILRLLSTTEILHSVQAAQELVSVVKAAVDTNDATVVEQDVRIVSPVIGWLQKEEIIHSLSEIVKLEDIDISTAISSILSAGAMLADAGQDVILPPDQLLISIAKIPLSEGVTVECLVRTSDNCFSPSNVTYFTEDVLVSVLETLIDETEIPILTMRIALRSLKLYPTLKVFMVKMLNQLIEKSVWEMPEEIWSGFVFIAKTVSTPAFPVLLRLPHQPMKKMLESAPDLARLLAHYYKANKAKFENTSEKVDALLT